VGRGLLVGSRLGGRRSQAELDARAGERGEIDDLLVEPLPIERGWDATITVTVNTTASTARFIVPGVKTSLAPSGTCILKANVDGVGA
jgi:hypothetical protein